ncbi:TPA: hypothetical protein ACH3X3_002022 [Trebouxia sp. C0006]
MAPRVLTISDIRVTNFNSPQQSSQQMPCCSFELGMARVSTPTVSPPSEGPSIDTVFGKHGALYIAFDPQVQGSAHLRVHLYSGPNPRPGNIMGLGSVSLVAAVQAGAVSVHLLDRFGQDAGDVEFVVHSDTPGEAPRSAAAHLTAADSAAADAIPAAEKGQQTSPMDEASPITPPQIQTNRMVPSSRSSTAGSDNGDVPVTFTANRLGHVASQDSYERGTFQNGVATPAFQDSYGASRQVSESTGREDPWARSMTDKARFAAAGAMSNVRTAIDSAKRIGFTGNSGNNYENGLQGGNEQYRGPQHPPNQMWR